VPREYSLFGGVGGGPGRRVLLNNFPSLVNCRLALGYDRRRMNIPEKFR
jgi:hypothetical protein